MGGGQTSTREAGLDVPMYGLGVAVGDFEDVTAKSGIFDASSKSLGVAMLDMDNNGWRLTSS